MGDTYTYKAFVSYRHVPTDRKWARWLVDSLETYRTPEKLVRQGTPPKIGRIFRDDDEIPASNDLSSAIEQALGQSEYLIVVCSPETPKSKWVRKEIEHFETHGKGNKILALLIDGEPDRSFPPELLHLSRSAPALAGPATASESEPIAADVRIRSDESKRVTRKRAILRIAAGLLGCSYDNLAMRDRARMKARRRFILAAAFALVGTVVGAIYGGRYIDRNNAQFIITNTMLEMPDPASAREREADLQHGRSPYSMSLLKLCRGDDVGIANASDRSVSLSLGLYETDVADSLGVLQPGQTAHFHVPADAGYWMILRDSNIATTDWTAGVLFTFETIDCGMSWPFGNKSHQSGMQENPGAPSKRSAQAIEKLEREANAGNAESQLELAERYMLGSAVKIDTKKSIYWSRKSAEAGNADAQVALGGYYWLGLPGFPPDRAVAAQWYLKAARSGHRVGQYNLAKMYLEGDGITRDPVEALKWYTACAQQADSQCQRQVGEMYEKGLGTPVDNREAQKWYKMAAQGGDELAKRVLLQRDSNTSKQ